MALKSTIYKADLQVADVDRGYYADHALTLARHPSETEERLMLRVLVFALHASDTLEFGRGISAEDEPDLWQRDLAGVIEHWIELGVPDERRLRRAAGRARQVTLVGYGERAFEVWWRKHAAELARLDRLSVWSVPDAAVAGLTVLADRNMALQALIQDGQVTLSDAQHSITVEPLRRHSD